jgi:hypothetical protein
MACAGHCADGGLTLARLRPPSTGNPRRAAAETIGGGSSRRR